MIVKRATVSVLSPVTTGATFVGLRDVSTIMRMAVLMNVSSSPLDIDVGTGSLEAMDGMMATECSCVLTDIRIAKKSRDGRGRGSVVRTTFVTMTAMDHLLNVLSHVLMSRNER